MAVVAFWGICFVRGKLGEGRGEDEQGVERGEEKGDIPGNGRNARDQDVFGS